MKKLIIVVIPLMLILTQLMIYAQKEIEYKILPHIELPLGSSIPKTQDFCKEIVDGTIQLYFQDKLVNDLNRIGNYQVKISIDKKDYFSTLTVVDKESPNLILKEVTILQNEPYTVYDFILRCTDNSGDECLLSFQEEQMEFYTKPGTYTILIRAMDHSSNEIYVPTKLTIIKKDISNDSMYEESHSVQTIQEHDLENDSPNHENIQKDTDQTNSYVEVQHQLERESEKIKAVLEYVNQYRKEVGLAPLILSNKLSVAATIRSLEMASNDFLSHTRPNGTECFSIYYELGIHATWMGENIAYGYHTPLAVSEAWKSSPSHYANIIKPNYIYIGIGLASKDGEYYWTQLFSNME